MNSNRRDFFKQLGLIAASVAVLPRIISAAGANSGTAATGVFAAAATTGPYKVFYTFTAKSVADATAFRELIKSCGVKAHNNGLQNEGHILSKTEFYSLPNGSMRSEIVFKSQESFKLFMESSKTVSAELLDFKAKKNIQIDIRAAV